MLLYYTSAALLYFVDAALLYFVDPLGMILTTILGNTILTTILGNTILTTIVHFNYTWQVLTVLSFY